MSNSCEICGAEATHVDSVPDMNVPGFNLNECGYRDQYLCLPHALRAKEQATSRVRCLHVTLDMDGCCYTCGADCRGGLANGGAK